VGNSLDSNLERLINDGRESYNANGANISKNLLIN
jgi:hypothetical protein